jgi:hypothetical protein
MQQYKSEYHDSIDIRGDIMLAFQNALNEQEQQLEQQQSKYSKLKHAFQELQDISNTQNRLICSIVDNLVPYAQINGLNPCC